MTSVSVIIPCRDAGSWIAQTIRSALAQHAPPQEIIVVDDGSSDRSAEIAGAFGPPVRVISNGGRGASAARNRGAAAATGRYLMFLDADDLLTPETLGALSRALQVAPGPAVALCPWDRYEAVRGMWMAKPPTNERIASRADPLSAWLRDGWSPPAAVLWSRKGYERSGGWDESVGLDQDGELMRRAFARGVGAVRTTEGLALYRRVPGSLSSAGKSGDGADAAVAMLERLLDELERTGGRDRYRAALVAAADAAAARQDAPPGVRDRADALIARAGGRRPPDRLRSWIYRSVARGAASLAPRLAAPVSDEPAPSRILPSGASANPLVSVVIPTHERPALTVAAVESALSQTWSTLEVIVVDDASTDDTLARVREIRDPRLRVIAQPENRGVAAARNAGIALSRGDLIAFLDSDDLWRPGKVARQVEALSRAPAGVGVCQCGSETTGADGRISVHRPRTEGRLFRDLLFRNVLHGGGSTLMVRREVIEAVGGFDERLPAAEDWEFFQRVARLFDVTCAREPLAVIRDDAPGPRRSARFRANMVAREAIFRRNHHALRRAGVAHLFLLDSARRELASPEGQARQAAALALRALAERPVAPALWARGLRSLAPRGLLRAAAARS